MKNTILKFLLLLFLFTLLTNCQKGSAGPAYDFTKLKREKLNRGLVAIRENDSTVNISWRYFSSDPINTSFDIYRNGEKINSVPLKNTTYFKDKNRTYQNATYEIRVNSPSKTGNQERFSYTLQNQNIGFINIPLEPPVTDDIGFRGRPVFYSPEMRV